MYWSRRNILDGISTIRLEEGRLKEIPKPVIELPWPFSPSQDLQPHLCQLENGRRLTWWLFVVNGPTKMSATSQTRAYLGPDGALAAVREGIADVVDGILLVAVHFVQLFQFECVIGGPGNSFFQVARLRCLSVALLNVFDISKGF